MTDERDLRNALAGLAAEDLAQVIEEARTGARARAREVIEDALFEEMVAAAATMRAARPAPEGTALWAYCVLAASDVEALPPIEGLEPGSATDCVVDGDLAVLVSQVPLAEYDDERLREHLNDIDWVERTARAHEAVLERALAHCTIVPLRLCTLFRDPDSVRTLLRDQGETLLSGLATLTGRAEWGLKVFVDPARLPSETVDQDVSDGAGYINRKQRERDARAAADELVARYAEQAHERVAGIADDARTNPVHRPEAHGRAGDMVLNGVYLVRLEREAELMRVVEEMRAAWAADGVELDLTGPWPGYNFATRADAVTP